MTSYVHKIFIFSCKLSAIYLLAVVLRISVCKSTKSGTLLNLYSPSSNIFCKFGVTLIEKVCFSLDVLRVHTLSFVLVFKLHFGTRIFGSDFWHYYSILSALSCYKIWGRAILMLDNLFVACLLLSNKHLLAVVAPVLLLFVVFLITNPDG